MEAYEVIAEEGRAPIKLWTRGVDPVEASAMQQLRNVASLPCIHRHVAVMPDVHLGKGSTIGSVIPTLGAIIPATVGVDIGCGMMAAKTTLTANDLPDQLGRLRSCLECSGLFVSTRRQLRHAACAKAQRVREKQAVREKQKKPPKKG